MQIINLPYPTSFTAAGPIIEMRNANVIIRYDHSSNKKQASWTKITFDTVYGYKFTECEYISTLDYEFGLVDIPNSRWIRDLLDVWVREGGNEESRAFGGEPNKVHHYRLYFDDYGLHEILCKSLRIEEEK
jgi:hypothetical protein